MKKYVCTICGFVYDEAKGIPEVGIVPGTTWEQLPDNWKCPLCGAAKSDFKLQEETAPKVKKSTVAGEPEELREMSVGELSALCSNLAKGCEKQYLPEEAELYTQLANYYKSKVKDVEVENFSELIEKINTDLTSSFPAANDIVDDKSDRGAKRALVWSEKVTRMLNSLIARYLNEGDAMFENTNVFVCEICGFIFVGDEPPEICPVCKVPKQKIIQVRRG